MYSYSYLFAELLLLFVSGALLGIYSSVILWNFYFVMLLIDEFFLFFRDFWQPETVAKQRKLKLSPMPLRDNLF